MVPLPLHFPFVLQSFPIWFWSRKLHLHCFLKISSVASALSNPLRLICSNFIWSFLLKNFFIFKFIFIYLAAPSLSCSMWALSCIISDLVPRPGVKPGPPALEAQSLSHWTTREITLLDLSTVYSQLSAHAFLKFSDFLVSVTLHPGVPLSLS